jgi:hypothetical protein
MTKKLLVQALGVLLVVVLCAPAALAETKFEFSGNYRVRYNLYNNFPLAGDADDEQKRANWDHRFRWQPVFVISDCLKLSTRIQAYNANWGDTAADMDGATYNLGQYPYNRNAAPLNLNRAWMDIKTKYGLFKVGRMYGGSIGLDPLGYTGGSFIGAAHGVFTNIQPFESTTDRDRIVYNLPLGAFTFSALFEKGHEVDSGNAGGSSNIGYDEDADTYAVGGTYKWATGSANLTGLYVRNRDYDFENPGAETFRDDLDRYVVVPAFIQSFGPFTMHFEFDYMWGTIRYDNTSVLDDQDIVGWGAYIDGWYNYGPGEVGGLFQYEQGTNWDRGADETIEGMMGYGGDHVPFVAAQGVIANHDLTDGLMGDGDGADRNYWALGVQANHNLSEVLMLHAALGYFSLVDVPDNYVDANGAVAPDEVDKDLGFELDLGLNWKIMEGLDFTSMVGYFWGGNAFEYGGLVDDVGNAYAWRNMLWLSF